MHLLINAVPCFGRHNFSAGVLRGRVEQRKNGVMCPSELYQFEEFRRKLRFSVISKNIEAVHRGSMLTVKEFVS